MIALAAFAPACNTPETNTNVNANLATPGTTTRPGPDNSTITTTTDANGVTTETRTFNGNPRVSKVVVTTRNGQKTARVYSASGEETDLKSDVDHALDAVAEVHLQQLAKAANQKPARDEEHDRETRLRHHQRRSKSGSASASSVRADRAIRSQVLLAYGDQSACVTTGRRLARVIHGARLEVLPGGHYLHLDARAALTGLIVEHLDG